MTKKFYHRLKIIYYIGFILNVLWGLEFIYFIPIFKNFSILNSINIKLILRNARMILFTHTNI